MRMQKFGETVPDCLTTAIFLQHERGKQGDGGLVLIRG